MDILTDQKPIEGLGKFPVYIGTKIVQAIQMTSHEFKARRGMDVAEINRTENAHGYFVLYEDGYQSWSPKEVFERCYRKVTESERRLM